MPTKVLNRAYCETATEGDGPITFGSPVSKYQSFADAGAEDGDTIPYVIEDGTDWERGHGVIGDGETTMTRVVEESSNSDDPLDLSGNARVYCAPGAEYYNSEIDDGLITGAVTRLEDYGSIT